MIFVKKKKLLGWCDYPPEDRVISIFAGCLANHPKQNESFVQRGRNVSSVHRLKTLPGLKTSKSSDRSHTHAGGSSLPSVGSGTVGGGPCDLSVPVLAGVRLALATSESAFRVPSPSTEAPVTGRRALTTGAAALVVIVSTARCPVTSVLSTLLSFVGQEMFNLRGLIVVQTEPDCGPSECISRIDL
jgi:hypothetical protein